jgi:predicted transcriptional regulator
MSILKIPKIKDAMRKEFKKLGLKSTLDQAILSMRHGINALPVVENDKLIGCVSLKDITKVPFERWKKTTVKDILSKPPIIYQDKSLLDVIGKMDRTGDHTFFVVDKDKKIVGMITRRDIIRVYSKI